MLSKFIILINYYIGNHLRISVIELYANSTERTACVYKYADNAKERGKSMMTICFK